MKRYLLGALFTLTPLEFASLLFDPDAEAEEIESIRLLFNGNNESAKESGERAFLQGKRWFSKRRKKSSEYSFRFVDTVFVEQFIEHSAEGNVECGVKLCSDKNLSKSAETDFYIP